MIFLLPISQLLWPICQGWKNFFEGGTGNIVFKMALIGVPTQRANCTEEELKWPQRKYPLPELIWLPELFSVKMNDILPNAFFESTFCSFAGKVSGSSINIFSRGSKFSRNKKKLVGLFCKQEMWYYCLILWAAKQDFSKHGERLWSDTDPKDWSSFLLRSVEKTVAFQQAFFEEHEQWENKRVWWMEQFFGRLFFGKIALAEDEE